MRYYSWHVVCRLAFLRKQTVTQSIRDSGFRLACGQGTTTGLRFYLLEAEERESVRKDNRRVEAKRKLWGKGEVRDALFVEGGECFVVLFNYAISFTQGNKSREGGREIAFCLKKVPRQYPSVLLIMIE
jgi:hypothetical protein